MKRGAPLATPSNRTCGGCDKQYTHLPKWRFGRFCSSICHGRSLRKEKVCKQCGIAFLGSKRQRFCGKECAYKSHTTPNRICVVCGIEFAHKHTSGKTACCSRECGWKYNIGAIRAKSYGKFCFCEWRNCIHCQKPFLAKNEAKTACCSLPRVKPKRTCTDCGIEIGKFQYRCQVCAHLRKKARPKPKKKKTAAVIAGKKAYNRKRRATKRNVVCATVTMDAVVKAHGARCHICKKKIDLSLTSGMMMPSIDHVVPLAAGGWHDVINCKPAHFICNSKKSDSFAGQMMLVYEDTQGRG